MPDRPALSDHALRETLDLLGEVVANMSQKLDEQGEMQARMVTTMVNGLNAILNDVGATRAQTDPASYARHIGAEVQNALDPVLNRLATLQDGFATDRRETQRRLDELVKHEEEVLVRLREELARADHRHRCRPYMALLGLVLVLGLSLASWPATPPPALSSAATGAPLQAAPAPACSPRNDGAERSYPQAGAARRVLDMC